MPTPPHVLPFLERCLASLVKPSVNGDTSYDSMLEQVAEQLSQAVQSMLSSKRALGTMSSASAQHLACSLSAMADCARCGTSSAVQHQAQSTASTFMDALAMQLDAAPQQGHAAWERCACNAARALHAAEPLLLQYEARHRGAAVAQLRLTLLHVARSARLTASRQRDGFVERVWGWDVTCRLAAHAADTARRHGQDPVVCLCQQLSHSLALCSLGSACASYRACTMILLMAIPCD